jgi:hypothetical protein
MAKGTRWTGSAVEGNLRAHIFPVWGKTIAVVMVLAYAAILSGCAGLVSGAGAPSGNPQATPAFKLNPANMDFGSVAMGNKVPQQASVTNIGTAPINITALTISSNAFSVSGATLPLSLGVGQGANFSVWFNSGTAGKSLGTLTAQADGGAAPAVINLSGTANIAGPQLSLSSSNLDLGTATVNTKVSSSVTLSNTGNADLTISVITVNGAAFGVSGIATPKTIAAGQSATMTVNFSPTTAGATSGSILLASNDPNGTATITLTGTGTTTPTGHLGANPSSLSFGNIAVGSNNTLSVTVTNSGQATVNISQVQVTGAAFTATGITAPTALSAGQSGTLQVKFAPTATGSSTGSISLVSDAPGSPLTINLTGTGAQSSLSASPSSLSFGSVVDGVSKTQQITVSNTGASTVTLSQASVSGTGFSISGITTPLTLTTGQSTSFNLQFAPQTAGAVTGNVVVTSNAANSPSSVSLSGTGVASTATMSASPTAVNFGSINVGTATTQNLTISNTGNSSVTISQINVTAKDVTVSGVTLPATLAPAQTLGMTAQFKPLVMESVVGSITVTNTQGTSTAVSVTGSGVQGGLTTTPASIAFGNAVIGVSNSQPVQISNTGNSSVTISQASVIGSGFSTSGLTLPLVLAAGQTSSFNVAYAPQTAGNVTGSVTLISDAPSSPNTLTLSGTGVTATRTLSVSQASLSFGSVTIGASASQTLTFTNTGNSNVTISQITESGAAFSLAGASTPVVLSPSQGTTITVNFNPTVAGNASGSVAVTSDATGSPANISLSGSGVLVTSHSVLLTWGASTSTVSGYFIYRSTTNGSGYTKLNSSSAPSLTYTDTTIQNSQTYYYVATAVDANGIESTYSNQVQIIVP